MRVVGRADLGRRMIAAATGRDFAAEPARITEMNERFMPAHMMQDRMAPEEPTSAPVMISAVLPSVTPMPAAAQPE